MKQIGLVLLLLIMGCATDAQVVKKVEFQNMIVCSDRHEFEVLLRAPRTVEDRHFEMAAHILLVTVSEGTKLCSFKQVVLVINTDYAFADIGGDTIPFTVGYDAVNDEHVYMIEAQTIISLYMERLDKFSSL